MSLDMSFKYDSNAQLLMLSRLEAEIGVLT